MKGDKEKKTVKTSILSKNIEDGDCVEYTSKQMNYSMPLKEYEALGKPSKIEFTQIVRPYKK